MERIFLFNVMLLVLVEGFKHQVEHHPKFPKSSEEIDNIRKVACDGSHDRRRNEFIEKARCGEPKETFVELPVKASYLLVSPSSVWVKRCVGLCDYDSEGSSCVPTKVRTERIPVRIHNVKTKKESCATYDVEVHESCGCCAASADKCAPPRVFNPRKCSCQCPNMEERRSCLTKRSHMRWNRYKCACEPKKRTSW